MPTGYTCIIEDKPDTTFREYALRCARAFGACITQRDEGLDSPPRHREPDGHYAERLREAEGRVRELETMSEAGALAVWIEAKAYAERVNREMTEKLATKKTRYAKIRAEVEAYVPPTPEHVRYREFMLEQIDLCYVPNEKPYEATVESSAAEHVANLLTRAREDVIYFRTKRDEEIDRCRGTNAWIDALVASLPR